MSMPNQSLENFRQAAQLRDQIIVANSVLEQLNAAHHEAKVEAIKWSKRLELAWKQYQFDDWLSASAYKDHYILKSGQLQKQIGEYTVNVAQLKTKLAELERPDDHQKQVKTLEQKFQEIFKLSQEALVDLKALQKDS